MKTARPASWPNRAAFEEGERPPRVVARGERLAIDEIAGGSEVRPAPALTYFIGGSVATMSDSRALRAAGRGPGWREMVRGEGGKAAETPERWLSSP